MLAAVLHIFYRQHCVVASNLQVNTLRPQCIDTSILAEDGTGISTTVACLKQWRVEMEECAWNNYRFMWIDIHWRRHMFIFQGLFPGKKCIFYAAENSIYRMLDVGKFSIWEWIWHLGKIRWELNENKIYKSEIDVMNARWWLPVKWEDRVLEYETQLDRRTDRWRMGKKVNLSVQRCNSWTDGSWVHRCRCQL